MYLYNKNISDLILIVSTFYYVLTAVGVVLLAVVIVLVIRHFSTEKKFKDSKNDNQSKPLKIVNIMVHILLYIIVIVIIGFLLYPFMRIHF